MTGIFIEKKSMLLWKSMYPFFCDQASSIPDVAIESLKIVDVLVDDGIVGDYKNLQKALLHKNDEVALFALDVLRKIKGLTIETRTGGVELVNADSSIGNMEKDLQSRVLSVLKKEDKVTEKLADIEKKVEELGQKTPEVPSNLTQDYDNKFKALENGIEELKKLLDSTIVNENALAEKVAGQVLERVKLSEHISKPSISSVPQFTQKTAEDSRYGKEQEVRVPSLDNTPETSIILLNWAKFLMEKVGRNKLADLLEYYVEIGWISEDVSSVIANYANGIDYYVETPAVDLLPDVHTKSMLFIEQLRRRKMYNRLSSVMAYNEVQLY